MASGAFLKHLFKGDDHIVVLEKLVDIDSLVRLVFRVVFDHLTLD
jgi:hypothetical protein